MQALVVQNAVAHEDGLGPLGEARRQFWARHAKHEATLRENFFSPAATRLRHVGKSPAPESFDPDLWGDELAFLQRPGEADIQTALFYDHQTNLANYSAWGEWLRAEQPPLLVTWGRFDPSFEAEAEAIKRDVPHAEVHLFTPATSPWTNSPTRSPTWCAASSRPILAASRRPSGANSSAFGDTRWGRFRPAQG